jgi:integrase
MGRLALLQNTDRKARPPLLLPPHTRGSRRRPDGDEGGPKARGGSPHTGRSPRLSDYLVSWLRDSVAISVGPKTLEGYEAACRVHIIPALGNVKLKDLTARKIQALNAQKMREGLSVRTRQNVHATLKRALKQAVIWGELPANPAEGIASPKAPPEDGAEAEEIKALTDEEARRLFDAAREEGDRFRKLYVS